MIRKILFCSIAIANVMVGAAHAQQAPGMPAAPTPGARPGFSSLMPPAMQMPQEDEATVRLVWLAVVDRFPEIVNGPDRQGTFVVAIALRPDGRVVQSGMQFAASPAETNASQQALRDVIPAAGRSIPMMGPYTRGSTVLDDRVLKANVILNSRIVPSNWDETRDVGLVRSAVLQQFPDLFLPRSADRINRLTVVMNENGEVAREKVESLAVVHQGTMTSVPEARGRLTAEVFEPLGLAPDQVGVMGDLPVSIFDAPVRLEMPVIGADGIARGPSPMAEPRTLMVRYAWPRRPGEPVGGEPPAQDPVLQAPSQSPMMDIGRLVEQYFPSGSPSSGNWMLLTFDGKVVRTGHVELGENERFTNTYLERQMPGIRLAPGAASMSHVPTPKSPGDPIGPPINVSIVFLAQGSPMPPPGELAVPRE